MKYLWFLLVFFMVQAQAVDLHYEHVNVKEAIVALSTFLKMNVVIDESVKGFVSLNVKGLTQEQAFYTLLTAHSLVAIRKNNILLIMPQEKALHTLESDLKYTQKQAELMPLSTQVWKVHYAKSSELLKLIDSKNKLLSARGVVMADDRTNSVWVQDTAVRLKTIASLLKEFDKPVKQVLIKARIVNATVAKEFEIGARLGVSRPLHLSGTLEGANALAQGSSVADVALDQRLNFNMPATSLFKTPASVGLAVTELGHGVQLDMELSAMEQEHLLEVVASPRLIASHGQAALIESGTEIPYAQETKEGATNASFKKAVLRLKVTPQISDDHKVILTLEINQDKPGLQTTTGVVIDTQHMKTQLRLEDQQTIVVGGIYETVDEHTDDRVPVLSRIPLLGYLFRHKAMQHSRKELLIFITPEILHVDVD